jgi:cell division protein FtsQ
MEPEHQNNAQGGPPAQPPKKVVKLHTSMRRRKRARVIWSRVAILIFFMLLFSSVFMLNSEMFEIKEIDVNGCVRVSEDRVLRASGIKVGENMLAFRSGQIQSTVGDIPLVKSVNVKRKVPSRIAITITERQPYAYVRTRNVFYMIDAEQVVLEIGDVARNNSIRMIHSDAVEPAEVGRRLEFPYDSLMVSFFDKAEPSLGALLTTAHFNRNGIKVYLNNGTYVLLGNGDRLREKLDDIPLLVRSLENAGVPYEGLNLRNLDAATFIKKKSGDS